MVLYARSPARRAGQIASDVWTLVWVVAWGIAGKVMGDGIRSLAEPARSVSQAAADARDKLTEAATNAGTVPGLGSRIRQPFDEAASGLGDIVTSSQAQVQAIEQVALLVTIGVFLIPVLTWVVLWLPRRLAFVRNATAAARFVDSAADLDLFALRAMATEPLTRLARVSDDPVSAWRRGDRTVIDQLARLGLDREGLPWPDRPAENRPSGRLGG